MRILGVVLAGGKSLRMGTDKGLVVYKGKPMVEHSIELLEKFTSDIVISTSNETYKQYNFPLIEDEHNAIGPLGGIYSVLKNYSSDLYFFIPCDVPEMSFELATKLMEHSENCDISIPLYNQRPEPLIGCYKSSVTSIINEQINNKDYKMQNLLQRCRTNYFNINEDNNLTNTLVVKNINRPEDVE